MALLRRVASKTHNGCAGSARSGDRRALIITTLRIRLSIPGILIMVICTYLIIGHLEA